MAKVSIIMAAYNAEDTIVKAIDSIKRQTFEDWELIICDDCSTDNTFRIISQLSIDDSRIKVLKNEKNMFSAHSRNRCISIAEGDYIVIQDSDDYSHEDRLIESIEYLEKNKNISFISSSAYFFDENGIWGSRDLIDEIKEAKNLIPGLCFVHAATTFRRECLKKVDMYREDRETRRGQDYDLFMRLYAKGFKGATVSKRLYYIYESKYSYRRRKYKYRIDEAIIRFKGYRLMKVNYLSYMYVVKPLLVGLLPNNILLNIKKLLKRGH